jgi:hypothetical protein
MGELFRDERYRIFILHCVRIKDPIVHAWAQFVVLLVHKEESGCIWGLRPLYVILLQIFIQEFILGRLMGARQRIHSAVEGRRCGGEEINGVVPWSGFREALAIFVAEYSAKAVVEFRYNVSPFPFRLLACLGKSGGYSGASNMDVLAGSCCNSCIVFEFIEFIKCIA